ncbi:hypothetical protein BRC87_08560 [Halobacteriales archaeon QS_4_66_20]|nr:MAG: hypothetical protein BRC87_08560 [Halobacteriales archaeon QS_4_66_20]
MRSESATLTTDASERCCMVSDRTRMRLRRDLLSVLGIHGTLATVLATAGAVVAVPLAPNPTVGGHLLAVKRTSNPAVSEPPLSGLYNDAETVEDDQRVGKTRSS